MLKGDDVMVRFKHRSLWCF